MLCTPPYYIWVDKEGKWEKTAKNWHFPFKYTRNCHPYFTKQENYTSYAMSTPALLHHLLHCFYSGLGQRDWNSLPAPLIGGDSLRDVLKASAQQWFSHARVTRARIPGLLHFLLSQPSQRNEKSGPFSTLKLKTKTAQKNVRHFHKNVGDSHKNIRVFWKNMGEVLENVRAFLETLGNPPNSTRTLLPLSPKNRKEESLPSKTSILLSTFFIPSRENPSVILRQNPPFQPSISPFPPAFP